MSSAISTTAGPGAHQVMEALCKHHSVDIQWGNHDVLWIGAACGSEVCMTDALRISLRYANLETLQEGYGLNVAPLVRLALEHYSGDYAPTFQVKANQTYKKSSDLDLMSRMQKAVAVIQQKLEGQLILRNPELGMDDRLLLHRIDYEARAPSPWAAVSTGSSTALSPRWTRRSPTPSPRRSRFVVDRLKSSWQNSAKLQQARPVPDRQRRHVQDRITGICCTTGAFRWRRTAVFMNARCWAKDIRARRCSTGATGSFGTRFTPPIDQDERNSCWT